MENNSQEKQGIKSRIAAAEVLAATLDTKRKLDEALDKAAARHRLSDADKRLVHATCATALRNLPRIDHIIKSIMDRKRDPAPKMLHHLLRIGITQLLLMEVAPHAAVNSCVSSCGSLGVSRQKNLVNAVLRSAQRQAQQWQAENWNALNLLPVWLRDRWVKDYGETEAALLAEIAGQEAPIDITVKDAKAPLQWAQKLGGEVVGIGSIRVRQPVGHIVSWDGFAEGAWWVQDAASALAINILGDIAEKSVLDMCAAPGGKTMQLAAQGAKVTALDVSASRMQRVTENLERVGLVHRVTTRVEDAAHACNDEGFDMVVLDAPCTSTGTLRRHPELPWIIEENQVEKTAASQRDLLRHASNLVGKGGVVLYCTCSLEVTEGEKQVEAFINENSNFKEIIDIPPAVQPFLKRGVNNIGWRTNMTALKDQGGMDGFFMALIQKQ